MRTTKERGKCTWEAVFKGVEFDLSFDHAESSPFKTHQSSCLILRTAIQQLDFFKRSVISAFLIVAKHLDLVQAVHTVRQGKVKNIHAVIMALEALQHIEIDDHDDEVSLTVELLLWVAKFDFASRAFVLKFQPPFVRTVDRQSLPSVGLRTDVDPVLMFLEDDQRNTSWYFKMPAHISEYRLRGKIQYSGL